MKKTEFWQIEYRKYVRAVEANGKQALPYYDWYLTVVN